MFCFLSLFPSSPTRCSFLSCPLLCYTYPSDILRPVSQRAKYRHPLRWLSVLQRLIPWGGRPALVAGVFCSVRHRCLGWAVFHGRGIPLVGSVAVSAGTRCAHELSCSCILPAAARRLPYVNSGGGWRPGTFHILLGALPTSLLRSFRLLFQSSGGFGGVFQLLPLATASWLLGSWLHT